MFRKLSFVQLKKKLRFSKSNLKFYLIDIYAHIETLTFIVDCFRIVKVLIITRMQQLHNVLSHRSFPQSRSDLWIVKHSRVLCILRRDVGIHNAAVILCATTGEELIAEVTHCAHKWFELCYRYVFCIAETISMGNCFQVMLFIDEILLSGI